MSKDCPPRSELDDLVMGRVPSRRTRRHVESCISCHAVLEQLGRDARLVQSLREAAVLLSDPATSDVIEACLDGGPPDATGAAPGGELRNN